MSRTLGRDPQTVADILDELDADTLAKAGHNGPPAPTPFEALTIHIDDLFTEVSNWADGSPITTPAQEVALDGLLGQVRDAEKALEAARKTDAKPFDDGKAAVQALYKPHGVTLAAMKASVQAVLAPYRIAREMEARKIADAARAEADRKAAEAREAARVASAGNLAETMRRDALIAQSEAAQRVAKRAEKAGPTGLRSVWVATLTDEREAMAYLWKAHRAEIVPLIGPIGQRLVTAGLRAIPGFDVIEERRAL